MNYFVYIVFVAAAYLLGAIPFGLLIGLTKGVDIRQYGSGNTGATNALRTIGRKSSLVVLILDLLKAALPVIAARSLVGDPWLVGACGLAAVAGHNWPVYIGWKGGKGVSSSLGVMAVLLPIPTLIGGFFAISLIGWTRYVSLGSVVGAVVIPLIAIIFGAFVAPQPVAYITLGFILGAMIIFQHRANIRRLLNGSELRLGQKAERSAMARRGG